MIIDTKNLKLERLMASFAEQIKEKKNLIEELGKDASYINVDVNISPDQVMEYKLIFKFYVIENGVDTKD